MNGIRTSACLSVAILTLPLTATAEEPAADPLAHGMHAYFDGERRGTIGFMTAGSGLVVAGGVMVAFDEPAELRAAAYPMLALGAVQLIVGAVFHSRGKREAAKLDALLENDRDAFLLEETARMEGVRKTFLGALIAESVLTLGGLITGIVGVTRDIPVATGFGFGLAGSAGVALGLDTWGAIRARSYLETLEANRAPGSGAMGSLRFRW
ncbi:MAG: hypothetical protein KJN97_18690 [Deltaproteobacteria bacterium]|nr:hypothetical protein [Deltaproteobacteria bacterium]